MNKCIYVHIYFMYVCMFIIETFGEWDPMSRDDGPLNIAH